MKPITKTQSAPLIHANTPIRLITLLQAVAPAAQDSVVCIACGARTTSGNPPPCGH